jgi:hypothetical protein
MKRLLFAGAAIAALTAAPAFAQQVAEPSEPTTTAEQTTSEWAADATSDATAQPAPGESGQLTVQGVTPAEALSAVDPSRLTEEGQAEAGIEADVASAEPAESSTPIVSADASDTTSDEAASSEVTVAETAPDAEAEAAPVATAEAEPATDAPATEAEATLTAEAEAAPDAESEATPVAVAEAEPATEAEATAVAEAEPMPASGEGLVEVADVSVPLPVEVAEVVEDGGYTTEDLVAAQLAALMNDGQQTAAAEPQEPSIPPG